MNKTQLSKIVRYLFVEQKYGVKEINKDDVWLLKLDVDFPIVCVVLNEHKDATYYQKKYEVYAKLLQIEKPLLLINSTLHEQETFVYHERLESTFINELLIREQYLSNFPDYMIAILQTRFKSKFGFVRWISLIIGFATIFTMFYAQFNFSEATHFLAGGYFRYAILNWQEHYRIITMLFSSNDIILTAIYLLMLYHYEYTFSLEHSRTKFLIVIVANTLITAFLLILFNVEIINVGLSSLIMCFAAQAVFNYIYLTFKYSNMRVRIPFQFMFMHVFLFSTIFISDPASFQIGLVSGLLAFWFTRVKNDKVLLINFSVAMVVLSGIMGYVFVKQTETKQINVEVRHTLNSTKIKNEYYKFKINQMEKENAR